MKGKLWLTIHHTTWPEQLFKKNNFKVLYKLKKTFGKKKRKEKNAIYWISLV